MFRDKPLHGVPRFDTRTLLMALVLVAVFWIAAHATGFHITGLMEPTELEAQEGYFPVGSEFMIVTKPNSPAYKYLLDLRGRNVRISVTEEE